MVQLVLGLPQKHRALGGEGVDHPQQRKHDLGEDQEEAGEEARLDPRLKRFMTGKHHRTAGNTLLPEKMTTGRWSKETRWVGISITRSLKSTISKYAFHCLLCACLRTSLSTFPVHASKYALHSALALASLYAFHCLLSLRMPLCFPCACIYALHSVLALCVPLCISLSTFPAHASMHFPQCLP